MAFRVASHKDKNGLNYNLIYHNHLIPCMLLFPVDNSEVDNLMKRVS